MTILTHWKSFFSFLKQPNYDVEINSTKEKSLLTFNIFLLKLVITFILALIIGAIIAYTGDIDSLSDMSENVEKLYNPLLLATMVALCEEFAFRGFLTKFNPFLFSTSIAGIASYFFKKIMFKNMFFEVEGAWQTLGVFVVIFLISFLIAKTFKSKLKQFWGDHFKSIFYASAFLFAFVHFFNSSNLNIGYLKTIIFQFTSALTLGYIRIRAGLLFAIIVHFIWDFALMF